MTATWAVLHRELLLLKRRLLRQLAALTVSPLLYLVAFGYAMGDNVRFGGYPYITFLLPGLVAMISMTQAFAIASEINIARFYWHVFDEIRAAPVSAVAYVAGEVIAGTLRALLGVIVVLALGVAFDVRLACGLWFWLAVLLDALVFASLAVGLSMLLRSHSDQVLLTNFVITPMAFLGGTFFPLDKIPRALSLTVSFLPISHANAAIRTAALTGSPNLRACSVLVATAIGLFLIAVRLVARTRD